MEEYIIRLDANIDHLFMKHFIRCTYEVYVFFNRYSTNEKWSPNIFSTFSENEENGLRGFDIHTYLSILCRVSIL